MEDIRIPKQKRAIDKKDKIIDAGFELICDKGYYKTNTKEIAESAGVSTGIVYQYFKDKHDILIAGIDKHADSIFYPMLNIEKKKFKKNELHLIIKKMIDDFIKDHKLSSSAHEEIMAMVHSDKDVAYYYHKRELDMTNKLTEIFINNNITSSNLKEKVHIIIGLIDNLCHEVVYHKHKEMNYKEMSKIVIDIIDSLLEK